ncbi:MAG: hypothetical protein MI810_07135 [Flavobacteriales bacterium]|jgi:hypothetical protein|nr:hypothetical protein [Flavobacteriales bacterium]
MKTLKKVILFIIKAIAGLGLIIGPMSWSSSYYFHAKYDAFLEQGEQKEGILLSKQENHSRWNGAQGYFISLQYWHNRTTEVKNRIKVPKSMYGPLDYGDTVKFWYLEDWNLFSSNFLIEENYASENITLFKRKYVGMGLTFYALAVLIFVQVQKRRGVHRAKKRWKNRPTPNKRE